MSEPKLKSVESEKPDNPFDLANLRLNQNFVESAGVKRLLTTVPVRKPGPQEFVRDGRVIEWHRSAASAAEHAMRRWVRVKANMGLGAYELFEAASTVPDPEWPAVSFQELIEIAFRDRLITNLDHPAIKRLRG